LVDRQLHLEHGAAEGRVEGEGDRRRWNGRIVQVRAAGFAGEAGDDGESSDQSAHEVHYMRVSAGGLLLHHNARLRVDKPRTRSVRYGPWQGRRLDVSLRAANPDERAQLARLAAGR